MSNEASAGRIVEPAWSHNEALRARIGGHTKVLDRIKGYARSLPGINNLVRNRRLQDQFRVELALIEGKHHNENTHKSILHFSVNKAATQYVQSVLQRCAGEVGMVHASLNGYAYYSDFPYLDQLTATEMQEYKHIFKPQGYLYSVFGGMIEEIPNLGQYHVVLMVRDPRDVLTSDYYWLAYGTAEPGEPKNAAFKERKSHAQDVGIDRYVIEECKAFKVVYQRYIDGLLKPYPNTFVTKYEQMTADFNGWLEQLLAYCDLSTSRQLLDELMEETQRLLPKEENVSQHIRQGRPGDHKRKLRVETVDRLNSELADVLSAFGYSL
jgi:Sulfotransferase domain